MMRQIHLTGVIHIVERDEIGMSALDSHGDLALQPFHPRAVVAHRPRPPGTTALGAAAGAGGRVAEETWGDTTQQGADGGETGADDADVAFDGAPVADGGVVPFSR